MHAPRSPILDQDEMDVFHGAIDFVLEQVRNELGHVPLDMMMQAFYEIIQDAAAEAGLGRNRSKADDDEDTNNGHEIEEANSDDDDFDDVD